ncbi:MAG: hypothetical protein ABI692_14000 [Terracoccus sp.]
MSPACRTILTGGAGFAGLAVFDGVGVRDGLGGLAGLVGGLGEATVVGAATGLVDGDLVGTGVPWVGAGGVLVPGEVSVAVMITLVGAAAGPGVALQAEVSAMDRAPSTPSDPFVRRARPRCCCMVTP